MNLWRALFTPWVAAHRSMRWLMAAIAALSISATIAVLVLHDAPGAATAAVYALIPVTGLAWVFFLPNMLVLTVAAHRLRLPGVRREVIVSLCLYALLTTLLPAMLLACAGASAPSAALILALTAGIGMLYALMPWYAAFALALTPLLIHALPASLDLPAPSSPGFIAHAGIAVLVLAGAAVLRWGQLLRPGNLHASGMRRPVILGLNKNFLSAVRGGDVTVPSGTPAVRIPWYLRPAWMQSRVDLRRTGPGAHGRVHTLRVALGGSYIPRTVRERLRLLLPTLLPLCLMGLVIAGLAWQTGLDTRAAWRWTGLFAVACIVFSVNLGLPLMAAAWMQRRFERVNAELPLLALLPGLGTRDAVKRDLLRACLRVPLRAQAVAAVTMMLLAWFLHLHGTALLLVLVAQLGSMLWLGAAVADVLGGRWLSLWVRVPLAVLTCMLFSLSCWIPLTTLGATPWPAAHIVVPLLLAAWLPLGVVLLGVGRRGWRALQQRPHAFMPSAVTSS